MSLDSLKSQRIESYAKSHKIKMERVKNQLLLNILKTDGLRIADIWDMAFEMMRVARAILLDDGTRPKPFATIEDRNLMEPYPTNEYLTNEYLKNEYSSPSPFVQQNEGFLEDFPAIQETLEGYNGEGLIPCWEQTLD